MILFHAKANGQVTTTPSLVPQGSSMQDLVVLSELDYALCTIKLEPASGIEIPDVVCTFIKTERGTTVWTAKLPPEAAKVAGKVTYNLEFTAADGTVQPTVSGSFTVPRRAKTTIPENVDGLKQYTVNELFALLSDIYASMTGSDAEIALLLTRLTTSGTFTIPPTEWTDQAPHQALVNVGSEAFSKGCVVLVVPENDATKEAAGAARMSIDIDDVVDGEGTFMDYVMVARAESGEAPTIPLNFRYVVLKTGTEDKALVSMIGVDAVGTGGASGGGNASVKSGYVSIPVSDWQDSSPTSATIHIDGFETGSVCLLTPADSATKTASEEARLGTIPSSGISNSVFIIRAQAGKVPTTQLNFKYMILRSEDDTGTPLAAIIGIDSAGSAEAGGVDETAVKNIIKSVVPEWARESTKPTYSKDEVGLGNVDNVKQYSNSNQPDYPVDSVNGKTGAVKLNADDVGARSSSWMPTAAQVGADPSGTAATKVSEHDTYTGSHNDIRLLIQGLSERLDAVLDSDDTTLDELSEIVAYIKSNKNLIDAITTSKVNVTDIINNLTTNVTNKPLSAAQGVALKALIDALSTGKLDASALSAAINTALEQAKASGDFKGDPGTSVTIKSISESAESGGENVVTFSDGKTLKVKNGKDGEDGGSGTYIVPAYWESAVDEAITKVKALQDGGGNDVVNFCWFSDIHYGGDKTYTGNVGVLCAKIMEECDIPLALMGGDTISAGANNYATEDILLSKFDGAWEIYDPIGAERLMLVSGNHEDAYGSYSDGTATNHYVNKADPLKIWNKLYRPQSKDFRRVFGGNGTYFYIENVPQKVRFVCMNSSYYDGKGYSNGTTKAMSIGFGTEQLDWFESTALSVDDGWSVVVAMHIPPISGYASEFNNAEYTRVRSIISNGAENIIGVFCGHMHRSNVYTNDLPCPIITVTCAINTPYDGTTAERVAGTDTETSIDIVSINKKTKTINMTRLGHGEDRVVAYGEPEQVNLYDKSQVRLNTRYSFSAGGLQTSNGAFATGWVELPANPAENEVYLYTKGLNLVSNEYGFIIGTNDVNANTDFEINGRYNQLNDTAGAYSMLGEVLDADSYYYKVKVGYRANGNVINQYVKNATHICLTYKVGTTALTVNDLPDFIMSFEPIE